MANQAIGNVVDPGTVTAREAAQNTETGSTVSAPEAHLTWVICGFGLVAVVLFYFLISSGKCTPFVLRIYVVVLLIIGTLLVVSSSYALEDVAPVFGFFGTIAGYLLGRSERQSDARD